MNTFQGNKSMPHHWLNPKGWKRSYFHLKAEGLESNHSFLSKSTVFRTEWDGFRYSFRYGHGKFHCPFKTCLFITSLPFKPSWNTRSLTPLILNNSWYQQVYQVLFSKSSLSTFLQIFVNFEHNFDIDISTI